MEFDDYSSLKLRRDDKVLHASINRPESMNPIDHAVLEDLQQLIDATANDDQTNVLVLTGSGKAFSAGGDLEAMQTAIENPIDFVRELERGKKLIYSLIDCPKPIIAKVNGPAIGLGATIALFCDIVFAARDAKIADPHVRLGFNAGDGGAVIWPALIGFSRAKAYLFTGDSITGEEAERLGLIYKAVDIRDLDNDVDNFARRIADSAPRAIQWTKRSANVALKQLVEASMDASLAYEGLANFTKDHQEALNAFREKRKPLFTGE